MLKTNIRSAVPPMRAGERESRAGGEQYCLSPLPLPVNSKYAVDVAHIDVRHDDVTMDLRQGESPEGLITAGYTLTSGFLFMLFSGLPMLTMIQTMYEFGRPGYRPVSKKKVDLLLLW
ncbi:hypothetical protein [Vreelandella sp. GE22]